jgi:ABC-2 type transport system ATP-binding protein
MSLIEGVDLTKIYPARGRNIVALDGLSFAVEPGETVAILGPAGAGKTSLSRVLSALAVPTTGQVLISGRPASDPKSRIGLGYLPEHPKLPGHLTALDALQFSGRLLDRDPTELSAEAEVLLERLDLGKWAATEVRKFSKDMLRRLALGCTLMGHPDLLIIDDPAERVDHLTRDVVGRVLARCKDRGTTMLLLSHTLPNVERFADRVLILDRGRIVRCTTVNELIHERLQVEIEADIGDRLIELPVGAALSVSVSRKKLIVELEREESLNDVIDYLRRSNIFIHSIQRRRQSPDALWQKSRSHLEEVLR